MEQFEVWHADGGTWLVLIQEDEVIRCAVVMRQLTRRAPPAVTRW